MKLKAEEYEPIELGDYRAKFTRYEEDEGIHGAMVKWFFDLQDEDYQGRSISGISSTAFNPMSKMWAWVQALLGRPIEDGEEIDLDDLIGREVMIDVDHKQTERGTFEKIAGLRPVRRKKKRPEPEPVEEEDEEEEDEDSDLSEAPF
jgi:hypothetical protein